MRILHRYIKNPCNVQYSIDSGNIEYGLLYNWYAVDDARNIVNEGWHIPTEAECNTLISYCGGSEQASYKLRETGLDFWSSPNYSTNEYKMNLVGSGGRDPGEGYFNLKLTSFIWTSESARNWATIGRYSNISFTGGTSNGSGFAVRPVKESTTLSHGETGTYVGNDGKVYQTICIGTQEWLADNLAETKYRNGNLIPEVTDNTTWAALTSGALCAFNNDWNYVGTTPEPDTINYTLISGELPITVELIGSTTYTNNHVTLESGSFTDIPGGTYTFKVTDALGCIKSEVIEIPYAESVALSSSYSIDRHSLETCNVYKGFDYTLFGFEGTTMFDKVKITSIPTNGTFTKGLYTTINVNDELNYPADFSNGLYYRTSTTEQNEYSDIIGFQVRINGLWSNTATITINVNSCITIDDCVEYGYLYNGYTVKDVRNIANDGWKVPTFNEYDILRLAVAALGWNYDGTTDVGTQMANKQGKALSDISTWNFSTVEGAVGNTDYPDKRNISGFSARAGGVRAFSSGSFNHKGERAYFWSSTAHNSDNNKIIHVFYSQPEFELYSIYSDLNAGNSVRLLKETTTLSHGETGTYIGNDGKIYPTICIGTQEWVASNLAETQYRNGDPIPTVEDATTWAGLSTGAMCAYNNDYTNVGCDETGPVPVVTTNAATNIGDTFATLNGEISGNATVTENGFCWGENAFPTKDDNVVVSSSGTGSISDIIESLECPTTYHFRAYAEYSGGIVYGENQQFTITTATLPLFYAWHRYDFQDGNGKVDISGSYQECADAIAHSKISGMGGWNGTLNRCLGAVVGNQIYMYDGTCVESITLDGWRVTGTSTASLKIINVLDGLIIEVYDE